MPEITAQTLEPPPNNTLPEVRVIQRLERSISTAEAPEVRKTRADLLSTKLEDHVKKIREQLPADQVDAVKVADTLRYFNTLDVSIGMSPVERIAKIYESLDLPTDPEERKLFDEALQKHMFFLGERAFDQHYDNPEQYVSHGFDHSIRVANYSNQIVESFPQILDSVADEYGLSTGQAKFMIENAGLFHDCGYCALARGSNKVAHSVGGLRIIADKDLQEQMRHLMSAGKDKLADVQFAKVMRDFEGAVLFHNADKVEKAFTAKVETTQGHWLGLADEGDLIEVLSIWEQRSKMDPDLDWFNPSEIVVKVKSEEAQQRIQETLAEEFTKRGLSPEQIPQVYWDNPKASTSLPDDLLYYGRKTDLEPGDKRIGLEYREADTLGYSMLALLRVGDNLDLLHDRFSEIQKTPAFSQMYRQFFGRTDLGDGDMKAQLIDGVLSSDTSISVKDKVKLRELGMLLDAESFKHFGGCEALKSVVFRPSSQGSQQAEIAIYVDKPLFEELQRVKFKEKTIGSNKQIEEIDMNVAEYQIWRLNDAVQVNLHGGSPIQIKVLTEDGQDITQSTFLQTGASLPGPYMPLAQPT